MLVLKNTFLELPLRNAMAFYQALPKVSQRNKVVAISVAVALSLIAYIRERVKPPKSIRHIPYINFMTSVKSIIKEDSVWKRAYNIHLPQMHSSKGIFSVSICQQYISSFILIIKHRSTHELAGL